MTSTDICAIVKACGESNVKLLKYQGLHVSFDEPEVVFEQTPVYPKISLANVPELNDNETTIPFELREEELDELMINDPDAWERTVNGSV